jgi:hypothetical protein
MYEICSLCGCIPAAARKRAGDWADSGDGDEAAGRADELEGADAEFDFDGGSRVKDRLIAKSQISRVAQNPEQEFDPGGGEASKDPKKARASYLSEARERRRLTRGVPDIQKQANLGAGGFCSRVGGSFCWDLIFTSDGWDSFM